MKLSLSRKSDAQPAVVPLWHPNFRNFERLPDTKVVRTTFFVNAAAITVALALLIWTGNREMQIRALQAQIQEAQAEVDRDAKQNAEALRLTRVFSTEEAKLQEALAFVKTPLTPVQFIQELGTTLPKEIQIDLLEVRRPETGAPTATLRGQAAGTKDQASGAASAYVEALRAHPKFAAVFESIAISSLSPDARSGGVGFEVIFKFKPEEKK
jgi:ABC-type multidrug transport system fused ATPase/permease subunit